MAEGGFFVSGPGLDRRAGSAAIGISVALTHASQRAHRHDEDASYYVRDDSDRVVGRVDSSADGTVVVYDKRTLDRASGSEELLPSGRESSAPRRSAGRSRTTATTEASPSRRRTTALTADETGGTPGSGTAVLSEAAGTLASAVSNGKEKGMTQKNELGEALAGEVARVTAKQAAVEVLRRAKGPLKADEIARRVVKTRGVRLGGATPAATVTSMLAVESKKKDGLFRRTEKSTYELRETAAAKKQGDRAAAPA